MADPSLDVIYVATPHNLHHEHVLLALGAGKHVLVEKPMALNRAQAAEMIALAREKGVFFAEALWTYFLPKFDVLQQVFDAGILGEIKSVHTDYGEYFTRDHRIFDARLAGGPLLDLGTYPVSLLTKLLGVPQQVVGVGQADPSGVNGQLSVILTDAAGNQGTMSTTLYGFTPTNAVIVGTGGTVRFGSEFNLPGPFEVISADGRDGPALRRAGGSPLRGALLRGGGGRSLHLRGQVGKRIPPAPGFARHHGDAGPNPPSRRASTSPRRVWSSDMGRRFACPAPCPLDIGPQ